MPSSMLHLAVIIGEIAYDENGGTADQAVQSNRIHGEATEQ